jgi:tetratricopeptide (TPR) repeat protein
MTWLQRTLLVLTLIILVPACAAGAWWYYWPQYVRAQAEQAMVTGDYPRAEELLTKLLRVDPTNLRAAFLRAQALRHLNHPSQAQTALERAMKLGLSESDGRREFALAEALKGFTPNAKMNLVEILDERPNDTEVLQALADGCFRQQRWADADRYNTRLLELEPDRVTARLARGRARLANVGVYTKPARDAAADFQEILRRDPQHFEAHLYLSHCYLADARMRDAKEELLICRQLAPDRVEPLVGLAACAVEDRDYAQAASLLTEAQERDPNSAYVQGMFGDLHLRQQHFAQAIPYFRRVVHQEPRNQGAHLKLAQALRGTGAKEQAKEEEHLFQRLRQEDGTYPGSSER